MINEQQYFLQYYIPNNIIIFLNLDKNIPSPIFITERTIEFSK